MRDRYQQQAFRDVQGARISRWVRESEAGWLFYGPDGAAWHITASEAETLEAEALALVERRIACQFGGLPDWRVLWAAAALLPIAAILLLPGRWGSPGNVLAVWFAAGIPLFLAQAVANDIAYEIALRRWRRAVASRLARQNRGGVPQPVAEKHRRYNLFQLIVLAGALTYAGRIGLMMTGVIETRFHPIDIAILAITVLAAWPADRVNATHRRRKWFD